jgi:hypothetical protein
MELGNPLPGQTTMIDGKTNALDREALKRKYLRCFGVRVINSTALQEAVQALIRQGVPRKTLVAWAVRQGTSKRAASTLLSRIFCALGLRERQAGAGRKASPEAVELLAHAHERYGEKCLKILRGALWAGNRGFRRKPRFCGRLPYYNRN